MVIESVVAFLWLDVNSDMGRNSTIAWTCIDKTGLGFFNERGRWIRDLDTIAQLDCAWSDMS